MNYTKDVFTSMIKGLFTEKLSKGFRRLPNGLYEDAVGQVYTFDIEQLADEDSKTIKLQMKPVTLMGQR